MSITEICPFCGPRPHTRRRHIPLGFDTVICTDCGLEHMIPRPTMDDLRAIYTESYYEAWNLKGQPESVQHMKAETSRGHLNVLRRFSEPGRILDVGCATGFFLEQAASAGWDPYGVELSEFAAAEATRRIGTGRIHNGLLETAPYQPASFRAITMMDCVEHALDLREFLETAVRLLEPQGCLLMTTPYAGSLSYHLMGRRWTHYKREHLQYFNARSMRTILQTLGLQTIHLSGAQKTLTWDYFAHQFSRYPHPLLTPLIRTCDKAVGTRLRTKTIRLLLGDMLAIGRKP